VACAAWHARTCARHLHFEMMEGQRSQGQHRAWRVRGPHQGVQVLRDEGSIQLRLREGFMPAQSLQEIHVGGKPTHLAGPPKDLLVHHLRTRRQHLMTLSQEITKPTALATTATTATTALCPFIRQKPLGYALLLSETCGIPAKDLMSGSVWCVVRFEWGRG
jgi:hypothetical protein